MSLQREPCTGRRGEEREQETKREEIKRKIKRIVAKAHWGFFFSNERQSLKTFCELSPTLYLPTEGVLDPFHFNLLWWLVWTKTFLVLYSFLFYVLWTKAVFRWLSSDWCPPPLWLTMWGQALTFLVRPCTVTPYCTFKSSILQVHSKLHLHTVQLTCV